jgi:hypothetical protein
MEIKPGMSWQDLFKTEEAGPPKASFFHPAHLARTSIHIGTTPLSTPGAHPITKHALEHHLDHGSMSFITAHNPGGQKLSDHANALRNTQLEHDLIRHGAIYHRVKGKYGGHTEDSFMIHHTRTFTPEHAEQLARKYGQESVLHTSNGQHQLKYVTGDKMGKHHPGKGYTKNIKASDNFSHPANKPKEKFSANLNWDELKQSESAKEERSKKSRLFEIQTEDGDVHEVEFNIDDDKEEE